MSLKKYRHGVHRFVMRVITLSQQNVSTLFRYFRGYLHAQSMLLELARTWNKKEQREPYRNLGHFCKYLYSNKYCNN